MASKLRLGGRSKCRRRQLAATNLEFPRRHHDARGQIRAQNALRASGPDDAWGVAGIFWWRPQRSYQAASDWVRRQRKDTFERGLSWHGLDPAPGNELGLAMYRFESCPPN